MDEADYVVYRLEDCATFFRRLVAAWLDGVTLALVFVGAALAFWTARPEAQPPLPFFVAYALGAALYLTALKRARLTLGYRLCGLKIVDLRGQPPGLFFMGARLVWWVLGPLNALFDLLSMSDDPQRQTLRDKLFGTCVVLAGAEPAARGERVFAQYSFLGVPYVAPVVRAEPR